MCETGCFLPSLVEHSTSNVLFLHDLLKLQFLGNMTDQFIFQLKLTVTLSYLCLTDSDASLHHNQSSISVTLSSSSSLWISDKYAVAPSFSCSPALTFNIAPRGTFRNLRASIVFFTCCVKFASLSNILICKCIFSHVLKVQMFKVYNQFFQIEFYRINRIYRSIEFVWNCFLLFLKWKSLKIVFCKFYRFCRLYNLFNSEKLNWIHNLFGLNKIR